MNTSINIKSHIQAHLVQETQLLLIAFSLQSFKLLSSELKRYL